MIRGGGRCKRPCDIAPVMPRRTGTKAGVREGIGCGQRGGAHGKFIAA